MYKLPINITFIVFSFWSQHFETDDPQLYRYKVEQIRDNDVNDLGISLRYTEDEMHEENGKQTLVVSR